MFTCVTDRAKLFFIPLYDFQLKTDKDNKYSLTNSQDLKLKENH